MTSPAPAEPLPALPPARRQVETFKLGIFSPPRIWVGLWQLSSNAWGSRSRSVIQSAMLSYVNLGYTAFADHYGSTEIEFGIFLRKHSHLKAVLGATKWCVFQGTEPTQETVIQAVRERSTRMRVDKVDLLQFHWNDYSDLRYLDALEQLKILQEQGLISAVGLCNFDSTRTDEICTEVSGLIVSNQVQFSLIDNRPLHGMADVCERHKIKLLTYGTLCGGFLSSEWLGKDQPDGYGGGSLTPSQRKYLDVITNAWGTWELFQSLLQVLERIAERQGRSIANVATRWVLDHPFVGAVIIGARLGISDRSDDNLNAFGFNLSEDDNKEINAVLAQSKGSQMITMIGDCGAEYRKPT